MYAVSNRFREQEYSGESLYKAKLSINNIEIPKEQISKIIISDPIIDKENEYFYIGTFISKKLTIKLRNLDNLSIKSGDTVNFSIIQTVDGDDIQVPIGIFTIDDPSENFYNTCEIIALDNAVKFKPNIDYSPCFVNGKATIDTILEYICNSFNVTLGSYPSINGNIEIGTYDSTISGKQWISYIAELKGCNAKITRDGKLTLIPFKQSPQVSINIRKSKEFILREEYKISGVTYFDAIRNYSFGNDDNNILYIRQDNPFVVNETTVENIYDAVKNFSIWALKTSNYGDISLDAWDVIECVDGNNTYLTYYDNTITYEQTIMVVNDIKIPTKQQEITTNIIGGNDEVKIKRIQTTLNAIEGSVEINSTEINSLNNKTAQLRLDVNRIEGEISEIADITVSADGIGSISLENINESEPINLVVRPTVGDIKLLYPLDQSLAHSALKTGTTKAGISKVLANQEENIFGVFPSETLYPNGGNYITFNNTTDDTSQDYILPTDLLFYDSQNYDEFNLDYESQRCYVVHRVGINQQGQKYVYPSPIIEELEEYPYIPLTAGNYTITSSVPTAYIFARLMASNIYTNQFATRAEMNSKITQTATEINAEVSQKVGNNEVISKINLTPETATIQANKININGMITAINNNTSTTINGNKITTGTITANQLSTNSITSDKIQAGAITSAKISAGAITGDKISAGTIDSSKVNASIITTSNFSAQSISANQITGGTINGNTVNVTNLNASSITAGTLSVARIPFLNASHISTGTLEGVSIDIGNSTYYLRMGNNWTKNPECSGLTIGSRGLRVNSGIDLYASGEIRFLNANGQQVATTKNGNSFTRTCSLTYQTSITGSKTTATFYFRNGLLVGFDQG